MIDTPLPVTFLTVGFLIICCLFVIGLGVYLLITGWRGRKLDDHPVCRKCRFDLFGLPTDTTNCPECGQNIANPREVLPGNRQRSRLRVMTGLLLICFVCLSLGGLAAGKMRRVNWMAQLPTWYLRSQTTRDTTWAKKSWDILLRRYNGKQFSTSQKQAVIQDAFDLQADLNRAWISDAGSIIETAFSDGTLSTEDWRTYMKAAIPSTYELRIRKDYPRGRNISLKMFERSSRIANGNNLWSWYGPGKVFIDDVEIKTNPMGGGGNMAPYSTGWTGTVFEITPQIWEKIEDGEHHLRLEQSFLVMPRKVYDKYRRHINNNINGLEDAPDVVVCWQSYSVPIYIHPSEYQAVKPVIDDKYVDFMKDVISIDRLKFYSTRGRWRIAIDLPKLPVALAHQVLVEMDGKRHFIGNCVENANLDAGKKGTSHIVKEHIGLKPTHVNVLLMPSEHIAFFDPDITTYWGKPIVFKDVPVILESE